MSSITKISETSTVSKAISNAAIQAKLNVSKPGDRHEAEADKAAAFVVNGQQNNGDRSIAGNYLSRTPEISKLQRFEEEEAQTKLQRQEEEEEEMQPKLQRQEEEEEEMQPKLQRQEEEEEEMQPKLQRQEEEEEEIQQKSEEPAKASNNVESKLSMHRGGGHAMDADTQISMEDSFGNDFSNVQIHTGAYAQDMSKQLRARAFTNGNDIYFNSGQYKPQSKEGRHLLAHELTHTIQQKGTIQKKESKNDISSTTHNVQGGFFGSVWRGIKRTGRAIGRAGRAVGGAVSSVVRTIGGALGSAWDAASRFIGRSATWVMNGLSTLGTATLNWLANAGSKVWRAISWFGAKAWEGIKWLGGFLWEKLVLLGSNVWSFISNLPFRVWRIIVHGWDAITGTLGWIGRGLLSGVKYIGNGVLKLFGWVGRGVLGGLSWLGRGIIGGARWAWDFIKSPSLSKLWQGLVDSIGWIGDGVKGLLRWGWDGLKGIVVWAAYGALGFAKWIWEGIKGGLSWIGTLIMQLLDLFGVGEALQIIWGLIFRMRRLSAAEISASRVVHPAGMIPYHLIRVDENSLISMIGGAEVTTMHVIHTPKGGTSISTMVHELTHVAQYEHVGSVYMPQAALAQIQHGRTGGRGSGSAYDYEREGTLVALRAAGKKFKDFNRESQAELVQDYYNYTISGAYKADLQPFIDDMQSGNF